MDNRVIGIGIAVVVLALYIRGVPQRIWSLVRGGQRETLSSLLETTPGSESRAANDSTPHSPGQIIGGTGNGLLPGTVSGGPTSTGGSIAQIISDHLAALQNTALDPTLNDIVANIPASNDPRIASWVSALKTCYAAGGEARYCANDATQRTGMSIFG